MNNTINGRTPDEIKRGLIHCEREKCKGCPYYEACMLADAHTDLHADALEYIQQLESKICKITQKVEQIKAEHQNLIWDFMDYINDGVPNPAPYCAFGESCALVDKRGWCRPGGRECNGFVPKVRGDNENAGRDQERH